MRGPSPSRLASVFRKELLEAFRDWKVLSLTLSFAPFFVLLMYAYLGHSHPTYDLAVANEDRGAETGDGGEAHFGRELVGILGSVTAENGDTLLRVVQVPASELEERIETRSSDLGLILPGGFSQAILDRREGTLEQPVPLRSLGDPANPDYLMAAVWADMVTLEYVEFASGLRSPAYLAPETLTNATSLTEFELYVPGLLALALMMLLFTAAGAMIREKDRGTLVRLRLSNLSTVEWLAAVSATQLIVGILALGLTYLTAMLVGYQSDGSLALLFLVGSLTILSIVAISVLVAAFLRTVFDLVTVGCFPFFILMFFSGGMFPLPGLPLFPLAGRTVEANEILPTTHAIAALNRVLSYDAGVEDILFEIVAILLLTVAFFALGSWVFTRRHLRAAR